MGSEVCLGVSNSTCNHALIEVVGSGKAIDENIRLRAKRLPPGLAGMFLGSQNTGFVPNPLGSKGNICLGGVVARFNSAGQYGVATGQDGTFELK